MLPAELRDDCVVERNAIAVRAVIEADGVVRPEETRILDQLNEELERLGVTS